MTAEVQSLQHSSASTREDRALTLRRAFKTNGVLSFLTGLLLTLDSAQVAQFLGVEKANVLGVPGPGFILELGVIVLIFAGLVTFTATRPTISQGAAFAIFVSDSIWVLASAVLILTGALSLTTAGGWAVLIAADLVLAIAVWEFIGIRRMSKS